jgi:superfamily II DNA or RNA helicase
MIVPATISSEIVIRIDDLPPMALEQIKAALTFQNEDREKNAALKIFGWWDLPETISMWREEHRRNGDYVICLPRGFGSQLVAGLTSMNAIIEWDDKRSRYPSAPGYFIPFTLRDYQLQATTEMIAAEQGIFRAPPAAGKTVTILGLMAWMQQRSVVIVDRANLLEQWRSRAAKFLGLSLDLNDEKSVGKIGEDVWEERDLTICLRQTLFSRLWEVKATDWFSKVGIVILDECQHLSGDSLKDIVKEVSSAMVLGVSATPARTPMQGKITTSLLGPIIADVPRKLLQERGILMIPSLEVVKTDLQADFWPTHDADDHGYCLVPNCKKIGASHGHRDNYQSCLKKLVENKDRNELIARKIVSERGHVHLIPSRQLKHLAAIRKACEEAGWDGPIFMLRGEENARGESQIIAEEIEKSNEALIFSTVAGEGLDIPPIDRVHMVFPGRQEVATIQVIGRCERVVEGKYDAVVIDYHDHQVLVFHEQFGERARTYRMQDLNELNKIII